MRTMFFIFGILLCIGGCSHSKSNNPVIKKDSIILSNVMLSKLDDLINCDSDKTIHKLFVIRFAHVENESYVILYKTYYYRKEYVDGYFFRNKNLVVFYNIKKLGVSNIVNNQELTTFKDSIPHYLDISRCDMQFEVYPIKYQIVTQDSLKLISENDSLFRKL
jgi:uncharacterized protein YcfL